MAIVQYSQSARFRCHNPEHGYRGSSVWVMPEKEERFVPFYACLHCAVGALGKSFSTATLEQVDQLKANGYR